MVIAGTIETTSLIGGAAIVLVALLAGYLLTRPKASKGTAHQEEPVALAGNSDPHPTHEPRTDPSAQAAQMAPDIEEHPQPESHTNQIVVDLDTDDESAPIVLTPEVLNLDPQLKHRIVYRFMPHLKGMLFEGDTLDGYLTDAVARAVHRGWRDDEVLLAARTGKWKKPRASH